jgi:hypothetical protein
MATTTNYNWTTPDDTALVKDGAAAIRSLGTAIDTTVFNNASAAIAKTIVDAKGDIIAATAADTVARLAIGSNDQVLTADSSTATGLKWAAPAATSFPTFSVYRNATQTFSASTWTKVSFDTESWDTNNNFASGTFTPTVAGYYQFSTALNVTSGSGNFYVGLRKNGSEYKVFSYLQSQSTWNQGGSCIGYANGTTDYFEVYVWCNGTSPSVVEGAVASWFMGIGIRS